MGDIAGPGVANYFTEDEAKELILHGASNLTQELRESIARGIWSQRRRGWCVVTYGHTYLLDEQGVSLTLWLNGTPYTVNPAYLERRKDSKPNSAALDIDIGQQNDYFVGHDSNEREDDINE
jgi:hypothetical protein